MKKGKVTITQILLESDKAEFVDWIKKNIGDAEKCVVMMGYPDGEGAIDLKGRQVGFEYYYELQGFMEWVAECFIDDDEGIK